MDETCTRIMIFHGGRPRLVDILCRVLISSTAFRVLTAPVHVLCHHCLLHLRPPRRGCLAPRLGHGTHAFRGIQLQVFSSDAICAFNPALHSGTRTLDHDRRIVTTLGISY
jgi:hypothetical protein